MSVADSLKSSEAWTRRNSRHDARSDMYAENALKPGQAGSQRSVVNWKEDSRDTDVGRSRSLSLLLY